MAIPNYYENDVTLAINSLKNSSPGWGNIPTLIGKHVVAPIFSGVVDMDPPFKSGWTTDLRLVWYVQENAG